MTQQPTIEQLLPVVAAELDEKLRMAIGIIFMNLMLKTLLDYLLTRYVESMVYQGWLKIMPVSKQPGWWR